MGKIYSIRSSLILNSALLIILLGCTIFLTTTIASRMAIRGLTGKIIKQTIDQAEDKLSSFFNPVAKELLLLKALGEKKVLALDDPDKLKEQFRFIMAKHPQVSSLMLADDSGRQNILFHLDEKWNFRHMEAGHEATVIEWDQDGGKKSETRMKIDYDPRERPWFKGATEKFNHTYGPESINWTDLYMFYTANEPGITASVRFKTTEGSEYVIGVDILLEEIQTFVDNLEIINQGQFVILTTEENVRVMSFSLKRYLGASEEPYSVSLKSIEELNIPLIQDAVNAFKNLKTTGDDYDPFRFPSEGQVWWGASKLFSVSEGRNLRISVIVPESNLLGEFKVLRYLILAVTAGVLIIGLLRSVVIANRYSRPIESLVESSKRISKGDFNPGPPVVSNNYEIVKLAEAHELMRKGLKTLTKLEKDLSVAREIQQKTFPEMIPDIPGFDIAGWNSPADETGGDTYDIIGYDMDVETGTVQLCRDIASSAILVVGDATGHGLGPALSVTQLRAMLRMGVHINPDIPTLLKHINDQLHDDLPDGRFITTWIGQIDGSEQTLKYFSAGQAPLIHYIAKEDKVNILRADIYPLGISDEIPIDTINRIKMKPGDMFAVISDGIFEAMNHEGGLFGNDRVIDIIRQGRQTSPQQIISEIRIAVEQFTEGLPASDDRTIILVKKQQQS